MIGSGNPFALHGGVDGDGARDSAVVFAVPHAGRDYPAPLLAAAKVAPRVLRLLEDRAADRLVVAPIAAGYRAVVASSARAIIDLNRDPREIDPAMVAGRPRGGPAPRSARLRAGLGLFPRAIPGEGALWRAPFAPAELAARIETIHAPYHAAIAALLDDATARHGSALLVDVHSMPRRARSGIADLVIGDARGRGADGDLVAALVATGMAAGLQVALNEPYAGAYTLARHGEPARGRHAVQLEFARDLYLDRDGSVREDATKRIGAVLLRMAATAEKWVAGNGASLPLAAA